MAFDITPNGKLDLTKNFKLSDAVGGLLGSALNIDITPDGKLSEGASIGMWPAASSASMNAVFDQYNAANSKLMSEAADATKNAWSNVQAAYDAEPDMRGYAKPVRPAKPELQDLSLSPIYARLKGANVSKASQLGQGLQEASRRKAHAMGFGDSGIALERAMQADQATAQMISNAMIEIDKQALSDAMDMYEADVQMYGAELAQYAAEQGLYEQVYQSGKANLIAGAFTNAQGVESIFSAKKSALDAEWDPRMTRAKADFEANAAKAEAENKKIQEVWNGIVGLVSTYLPGKVDPGMRSAGQLYGNTVENPANYVYDLRARG